jgi:predicted hotdog family 3-hydroxylacyl-ACP dehydratase
MTRPEIAALVPQQGAMCLLEEVVRFDERSIECRTSSHLSPANPLRCDGRLPACTAVEYAAQAMAVHGALRTSPAPQVQAGLLAGARALKLNARFLDDEPGPLTVRAERLVEEGGRLLYAFAVEGAGGELAAGRIAVVLRPGALR